MHTYTRTSAMHYDGVDVNEVRYSSRTFASAVAAQTMKVYTRLTHTPFIALHLNPRTAAAIEQYSMTHIQSPSDLEQVLRALSSHMQERQDAHPCPTVDETDPLTVDANKVAAAAASAPRRDADLSGPPLPRRSTAAMPLDAAVRDPTLPAPSSTTETEPSCTPSGDATTADAVDAGGHARILPPSHFHLRPHRRAGFRHGLRSQSSPPPPPARHAASERDTPSAAPPTPPVSGRASARSPQRRRFGSHTSPRPGSGGGGTGAPPQQRLPPGLLQAFTRPGCEYPAHSGFVDRPSSSLYGVQHGSGGMMAEGCVHTRLASSTAPAAGVGGVPLAPPPSLSQPPPLSSQVTFDPSSLPAQLPSTAGPAKSDSLPPPYPQHTLSDYASQQPPKTPTPTVSESSPVLGSATTQAPPPFFRLSEDADCKEPTFFAASPLPPPATAAPEETKVTASGESRHVRIESKPDTVVPTPLSGCSGEFASSPAGNDEKEGTQPPHSRVARPPPLVPLLPPPLPATKSFTTAVRRRGLHLDRCEELEGWLNLLLWTKQLGIFVLRELATAQGVLIWSAWYWAYVQEHAVEGTVHRALSSISFWKSPFRGGWRGQVGETRFGAATQVLSLRRLSRLVVGCCGSAHSALERMNMLVADIQKQCEAVTTEAEVAALVLNPTSPHATASYQMKGYESLQNEHGSAADSFTVHAGTLPVSGQPTGAASPAPGETGAGDDLGFDQASEVTATTMEEAEEDAINLHAREAVVHLRRVVFSTITAVQAVVRPRGVAASIIEGEEEEDAAEWLWADDTSDYLYHPELAVTAAGTSLLRAFAANMPPSPQLRQGEYQRVRRATLEDGVNALLHCTESATFFVSQLKHSLNTTHHPPASRHWRRVVLGAVVTLPALGWLCTQSSAQLTALAGHAWETAKRLTRSYVVVPMQQLRDAVFYVRPGVEERRQAFESDAKSLANIIRDYHEDFFPAMRQDQLDALRDYSYARLLDGTFDDRGYALIQEQYSKAARHPVRSMLFGDLSRLLLIELTHEALEMGRVINGMDDVLDGNDLNFKVAAMVPMIMLIGVLSTWALVRWRAKRRPVKRRMKMYWRAIHRVVTLAGNEDAAPSGGIGAGGGANIHVSTAATAAAAATLLARRVDGEAGRPPYGGRRDRRSSVGPGEVRPHYDVDVYGARRPTTAWTGVPVGGRETGPLPASSQPDRRAATATAAEVDDPAEEMLERLTRTTMLGAGLAESVRSLNNFEQGQVLLIVHLMRTTAVEHFRHYHFFHELMEDLGDLETMQNTRHQRLETLQRMQVVHYLFH